MRVRVPLLTLLLVGPLLSGCSLVDRGPLRPFGTFVTYGVPPATLPDNLCDVVPPGMVTTWQLTETDHESATVGTVKSIATCTMSGTAAGDPISVDLRLESRAGEDQARAEELRDSLYFAECNDLMAVDNSPVDYTDEGCSVLLPRKRYVVVRTSFLANGVARVDVQHGGDRLLETHVRLGVSLLGSILTGDPADFPQNTTGA